MRLEPNNGGFTIEAADLAGLLGMPATDVQALMRSGAITTRSERGEGEDAGRFRVTFIHDRSQVRLIVTGDGDVLHVSRIIWPSPSEADAGRAASP